MNDDEILKFIIMIFFIKKYIFQVKFVPNYTNFCFQKTIKNNKICFQNYDMNTTRMMKGK